MKPPNQSEILAIISDQAEQDSVSEGDAVIITKKTPFYGESGGQVGDIGIIKNNNAEFQVTDTQKAANDLTIHIGKIISGKLKKSDQIDLEVTTRNRSKIKSNHSATHLLHKALQEELGDHVSQKGSYVSAEILRFDFTHNKQVSKEELRKIENRVNQIIRQNSEVATELMSIEDAKKSGAMALFGEKYDAKVRVLSMGQDQDKIFSKELCGGTHVKATGDIGVFKITSESSIAAGIRRIEAITGEAALTYLQDQEILIEEIANNLKSPKNEISTNIENLITAKKQLEKEISKLKQANVAQIDDADIFEISGDKILFKIADLDAKNARELAFQFKAKEFASIILITSSLGKAGVIVVSNNPEKFNAVELTQKTSSRIRQ